MLHAPAPGPAVCKPSANICCSLQSIRAVGTGPEVSPSSPARTWPRPQVSWHLLDDPGSGVRSLPPHLQAWRKQGGCGVGSCPAGGALRRWLSLRDGAGLLRSAHFTSGQSSCHVGPDCWVHNVSLAWLCILRQLGLDNGEEHRWLVCLARGWDLSGKQLSRSDARFFHQSFVIPAWDKVPKTNRYTISHFWVNTLWWTNSLR